MNPAYYSKRPPFRIPRDHGTASQLKRAMAQVNLRTLCENVYGLRKRDGYYFSPVREDGQNPAFGLRSDGEVGIDHATDEGFNALSLIARVENLTLAEARQRLIFYAEHGFGGPPQRLDVPRPVQITPLEKFDRELHKCNWPPFEAGTVADYVRFGALRGLSPATLMIATSLRLFFFFADRHSGQRLCTVTDDARYVRQDRCIDGSEVALHGGGTTKNRTIGAGSWPVGAANIGSRSTVLLVEGMPDLLAAVQLVEAQGRFRDTSVVAMLGAKQRMHPQAFPFFAGKRVRLFPHLDEPGAKAAACWTCQLRGTASEIDSFCFADFMLPDGKQVKDLNDFIIAGAQRQPDIIPAATMKGGNDV